MSDRVEIDPFLDANQLTACVHCGLCLGACPTYLETGNENDSPRGRLYLMKGFLEQTIALTAKSVSHMDCCLGCRACETACPSGVKYGALLEDTRDHIEAHYKRSWFQWFLRRIVIEKFFPIPTRMKWLLAPAFLIRALKLEGCLPTYFRNALSLIPKKLESAPPLAEITGAVGEAKGKVGFIDGCVMNVMFQKTNYSTVQLLRHMEYDVVTPSSQGCCGALFSHGGNLKQARDSARRNIAAFEKLDLDTIIINAAGCGSTLKEYGHLLSLDPDWQKRAEAFSAKIKDLSEFLMEDDHFEKLKRLQKNEKTSGLDLAGNVTYHDACHLAHPQSITQQPRELIRNFCGDRFVELPESEICCGSAGSYNLTEPEMAGKLQTRKTRNILSTGAKTVITTNPGCLLQIRAGLNQSGNAPLRVGHLADWLWEQIDPTN
ncbi:MAG TPA: (Fe-S)-binding protein [Verrucomicrobiales bacterium]|nr:(Fe-S)-binding protein [Verrucomicrobiales bacterium]HIL72180.1 (Fe-S)-binding protein [Verrucomicrobiota bacterium]